jgi:hypothetical protein
VIRTPDNDAGKVVHAFVAAERKTSRFRTLACSIVVPAFEV